MNVAQLIQALSKMPQDAEVQVLTNPDDPSAESIRPTLVMFSMQCFIVGADDGSEIEEDEAEQIFESAGA